MHCARYLHLYSVMQSSCVTEGRCHYLFHFTVEMLWLIDTANRGAGMHRDANLSLEMSVLNVFSGFCGKFIFETNTLPLRRRDILTTLHYFHSSISAKDSYLAWTTPMSVYLLQGKKDTHTHTNTQTVPKIFTQVWGKKKLKKTHEHFVFRKVSKFSEILSGFRKFSKLWIQSLLQFMRPGYLVRIRIHFIPVVSDMALVNGFKGLVRNWR